MATIKHANFAETTLAAAITTTNETSITVTSEAGFPAVDFIISIGTEAMLVTNVSTVTWTVTRGYESSTAATHLNGAAIYHDWSAGEADSTVHGPASATDEHLAVFDSTTGKLIKDGGAIPAAGLPTTGGTLTGNLVMDNMDVTLVKLLTLHGEIDDGNSSTADTIDWNTGAAHKSTLTGNVTFAFTGTIYGADVVPTMSNYAVPSGEVTESGHYDIGYGWKVFDEAGTTYWITNGGLPAWVAYKFAAAKTIKGYGITCVTNLATEWTLAGSNDGAAYTTLDFVTGASLGSGVMSYYVIDTPASYQYYRLTISAGSNYTQLDYLYLIEDVSGIVSPSAPCFLTLKLVQDGTGGRTVTWPATVKGAPVINPAASSISNVLFYWDGTNYYTLNGLPWVGVPASKTAAGMAGQMAYASGFIYVCVSSGAWQRAAIADW